jgi:hypothetical protein
MTGKFIFDTQEIPIDDIIEISPVVEYESIFGLLKQFGFFVKCTQQTYDFVYKNKTTARKMRTQFMRALKQNKKTKQNNADLMRTLPTFKINEASLPTDFQWLQPGIILPIGVEQYSVEDWKYWRKKYLEWRKEHHEVTDKESHELSELIND